MPIEVGISTDRKDKKIMEKEKKAGFSGVGTKKYDYDRQYHKDHYKRVHLVVKPELWEQINQAAADSGMSKNGWIIEAIKCKLKGLY